MSAVYLLLLTFGGVVLFLDIALDLMFGIRELRANPSFLARLKSLDRFTVLPANLTLLLADCTLLGILGWLLEEAIGFTWYISLPGAVIGTLAINAAANGILARLRAPERLPESSVEGLEGEALEDIPAELYGQVRFILGDREYIVNAIDANGIGIAKGERVLIVSREEELYFVESIGHIYDLVDI